MPINETTASGGDLLPSLLRTFVPVIVGFILGVVGSNAVGVTEESLTAAVSTAITIVYYLLVRLLEQKWPKAGLLLGTAKKPVYGTTTTGG